MKKKKKKKEEALPEIEVKQVWVGEKTDMIQMMAITKIKEDKKENEKDK